MQIMRRIIFFSILNITKIQFLLKEIYLKKISLSELFFIIHKNMFFYLMYTMKLLCKFVLIQFILIHKITQKY